jgi:HxlR-like helix-turn-helix
VKAESCPRSRLNSWRATIDRNPSARHLHPPRGLSVDVQAGVPRPGRPRPPCRVPVPRGGADGSAEISAHVLSRELKSLAAAGLIARKDYGLVPPKVEYRLTRSGQSFVPIIAAVRKWGARHLGDHATAA